MAKILNSHPLLVEDAESVEFSLVWDLVERDDPAESILAGKDVLIPRWCLR